MVCGSIMPWVWNIFQLLRIIPDPTGSKYINRTALIGWLVLITTCTVVVLVEEFYCDGQLCTFPSNSYMITALLSDVLVPLQSMLLIKEIAALAEEGRDLKSILLFPASPCLWLMTTILHFASFQFLQYYIIRQYEDKMTSIMFVVAFEILLVMHLLIMSAARAIIGVLVNRFYKNLDDCSATVSSENIQITVTPIITEYKTLKELLKLMLFGIFTVDVILLTSNAYFVTKVSEYDLLPFTLYLACELSYIAFVLDDCYSMLKSTLPIFR